VGWPAGECSTQLVARCHSGGSWRHRGGRPVGFPREPGAAVIQVSADSDQGQWSCSRVGCPLVTVLASVVVGSPCMQHVFLMKGLANMRRSVAVR
jgi:hypothetical protein